MPMTSAFSSPEPKMPLSVKLALGVGIGGIGAAALVLWATQGSKVFLDALAAGIALCL